MDFMLKTRLIRRLTRNFIRCLRLEPVSFRLYSTQVRVRFAPSPTGFLHLGGLRTALYNYLLARSRGGKFILRIEDTDRKRLVPEAAAALENDLIWAGLDPDESPLKGGEFGPYLQSQRTRYYVEEVMRLVEKGSAYHCFCSERRLDLLRKNAVKNREVPKYDNRCRNLAKSEVKERLDSGKESCIRFKLSRSDGFDDMVYGRINYRVEDVEGDPVILKNDGLPTYHLANVVDDHHMKITHVVRGVEWLQSTDKHIMIYRALGYAPPVFAHLPLLLNSDGSKLSKRQGDLSVSALRMKGVQPQALINFLSSLGGGFKSRPDENLSLSQLSDYFDIKLLNSYSCKLPLERLDQFNRQELIRLVNDRQSISQLIDQLRESVIKCYGNKNYNLELEPAYIEKLLKYFSNRICFIDDLLDKNMSFLWIKPDLHQLDETTVKHLKNILIILKDTEFEKPSLSKVFKEFTKTHEIEFKSFMHLLRLVLCGSKEGPGVAEMMQLLGRETTLNRLNRAVNPDSNVVQSRANN